MKISIVLGAKDIEHKNDVFLIGIIKWIERELKFMYVLRLFNGLTLAQPHNL